MDGAIRQKLRVFVRHSLDEGGDEGEFSDQDSLFVSGRLDSLAMTRLVIFLEEVFNIDFGSLDFSAELVDSVDEMAQLVQAETSGRLKPA